MNQIETVFQGRVITVNVEQVLLPNGKTARYEIVHHPGGAAIVAVDSEPSRLPAAPVPACCEGLGVGTARGPTRTRRTAA